MEINNQTVIGTYDNRDDALKVVSQLKNEGYQKQDIVLYSNDATGVGDHDAMDVSTNDGADRGDSADDRNLWDKMKDAFTSDSYNHEKESIREGYDQYSDVLYPYRDALNDGKIVLAVNNFKGESVDHYQSSNEETHIDRDTQPAKDPLTEGREFDRETE
jgi:hypothetical protein